MNKILLSSGHRIPQIGLGTWKLTGGTCRRTVAEALGMGYRHIDTADAYGNHRDVGRGIADSGIARELIFLTTKIPMSSQSSEAVRQFGDRMRDELATDYVDLLLIHWPVRKTPFSETLGAMENLVEKGYTRSIGISNFNADIAAEVQAVSSIPVVTNQVEFHPLLYQKDLLEACGKLDMVITAYSPLARQHALTRPEITSIAEKHGVEPSAVCIAWLLEKGVVVIPKASTTEHLESNLNAPNLELDSEDIEAIDSIEETLRAVDGPWKQYEF